jgi:hypothetical protein
MNTLNPTNVTGTGLPDSFNAAVSRAERDGVSLAEGAERVAIDQAPPDTIPVELREVQQEKDRLAREQSELDQREAAALEINRQWKSLCRNHDQLEKRFKFAMQQREEMAAFITGRADTIADHCFGDSNNGYSPLHITPHYSHLICAERALVEFDKWLKRTSSELLALATERDEYAALHGIVL